MAKESSSSRQQFSTPQQEVLASPLRDVDLDTSIYSTPVHTPLQENTPTIDLTYDEVKPHEKTIQKYDAEDEDEDDSSEDSFNAENSEQALARSILLALAEAKIMRLKQTAARVLGGQTPPTTEKSQDTRASPVKSSYCCDGITQLRGQVQRLEQYVLLQTAELNRQREKTNQIDELTARLSQLTTAFIQQTTVYEQMLYNIMSTSLNAVQQQARYFQAQHAGLPPAGTSYMNALASASSAFKPPAMSAPHPPQVFPTASLQSTQGNTFGVIPSDAQRLARAQQDPAKFWSQQPQTSLFAGTPASSLGTMQTKNHSDVTDHEDCRDDCPECMFGDDDEKLNRFFEELDKLIESNDAES